MFPFSAATIRLVFPRYRCIRCIIDYQVQSRIIDTQRVMYSDTLIVIRANDKNIDKKKYSINGYKIK